MEFKAEITDEILNSEQVAKFMKIHPVTVRRLAKQEVIPARKVGKEWRFNKQAILQWIVGDTKTSGDERANTSWHSDKTHKVEFGKSRFLLQENAIKEAQAQLLRSTRGKRKSCMSKLISS